MKETYYFPHDYHARHDLKLETLSMEKIGIFWCLVEMLYEENGYINLSLCKRIATALRTQCDTVKSVINDYQLFENDGIKFWSNSVLKRLKIREEKSNKARSSALKRWNVCDRNAIKERKGKERKVKERKVKESKEESNIISKDIMLIDYELSNLLIEEITKNIPTFKKPNIDSWASHISKMRRIDNRTPEQIEFIIKWCQQDSFWRNNILSTNKLREKFDQLTGLAINNKNNIAII